MRTQLRRALEVFYDKGAQLAGSGAALKMDEKFLESLNLAVISWVNNVFLDIKRDEGHNVLALDESGSILAEFYLGVLPIKEGCRDPAH